MTYSRSNAVSGISDAAADGTTIADNAGSTAADDDNRDVAPGHGLHNSRVRAGFGGSWTLARTRIAFP